MCIKSRKAVSLIEVMIALAILSTLVLPSFMFIFEYSKGGSDLGDRYEVLNRAEERIEAALAIPFHLIPEGKTTKVVIEGENGRKLDLNPITLGNNTVEFECEVKTIPVDFTLMKNFSTRQLQKARLENGMKRITVTAQWGKGKRAQNVQLMAYKANL